MTKIRQATDEDCRFLWELANDPDVRAWSFESDIVSWDEHMAWFRRKRNDPRCHLYIVLDDDRPVGQVRFDIDRDRKAEVSISIVRHKRGKGYGALALRLAREQLRKTENVLQIVAHIKPLNKASIRSFEKAGFVLKERESIKGQEALKYCLSET